MSGLMPKEWILGKASDFVVSPKNDIVDGPFGSNLKASEYQLSGTPIIRLQNIKRLHFINKNIKYVSNEKAAELSRHSYKKGDIVITKLGDPLGLACIIPENFQDGIIVADLVRLRINDLAFDKRYLTYLLNSPLVISQLNKHIKGTTRPRINLGIIRDLNLPIASISEQKVVAEKLDTLLAQVDSTKARLEQIPQILKHFRQAVLAAAMNGKLTTQWRLENNELDRINLSDIDFFWRRLRNSKKNKNQHEETLNNACSSNLPETWLNTKIGNVFDVHVGSTPRRNQPEFWNGDIPWVSSSEVAFCRIYATKEMITKKGLASSSTKIHPAGTVMLAMIGQGKTRGQVAILNIDACHNQNTAAIRVPGDFASSEFLYFYLSQRYNDNREIGAGNNQKAMNKSIVESLIFPLPPLKEQHEIVRRVEQLFAYADTIEKQVNNALTRVNNLTQSILAKAFRGELTAQWRAENPDLISGENSAAALLEKIKAERAASGGKKTSRKKV